MITQKEDETKYIQLKETSFIGIIVRSILKNMYNYTNCNSHLKVYDCLKHFQNLIFGLNCQVCVRSRKTVNGLIHEGYNDVSLEWRHVILCSRRNFLIFHLKCKLVDIPEDLHLETTRGEHSAFAASIRYLTTLYQLLRLWSIYCGRKTLKAT